MNTVTRIATLAAGAAFVAGSWYAIDQFRDSRSTEFAADFSSTVGLYPGSDVQMLGVTVGEVTAIEPAGGHVRVTMKLDPGFEAAADTKAVIIAPTLVSDRFVQLTEPNEGGQALKDGTVIAADRTAVPVEIDDLYRSLTELGDELGPGGANQNGALSDLISTAAKNLDGNGEALNTTIKEFGEATATLANSDESFFATLANLKEFNDMLVANDDDVASLNQRLDTVADYLADDRDDLALAVTNMAEAMAVLEEFVEDNRDHLTSSVEKLTGPTQTLVDQKDSLEESVRLIPVALQNVLKAYNADANTIDGRGNLNELSIWSTDGLTATTSASAPPVLLVQGEDR